MSTSTRTIATLRHPCTWQSHTIGYDVMMHHGSLQNMPVFDGRKADIRTPGCTLAYTLPRHRAATATTNRTHQHFAEKTSTHTAQCSVCRVRCIVKHSTVGSVKMLMRASRRAVFRSSGPLCGRAQIIPEMTPSREQQ